MNPSTEDSLNTFILEGTEQCVACGLCLPWCPTYQMEQSEFESPRGRLALLHALARDELTEPGPAFELLDHCLLCRSCERHCPSSVPFADVMDAGRRLVQRTGPQPGGLSRNLAEFALRRPEWLRRTGIAASGLRRLLPSYLIRKATAYSSTRSLAYLPSVQAHTAWHSHYPCSADDKQGRVSLFLGCAARTIDAQTIDDTIRLLNMHGFDVHIPAQQACCGALSLHAGRHGTAIRMMQANIAAFGNSSFDAIVHMATGCGVTLSEYPRHTENSHGFSDKVSEICAFVERHWRHMSFASGPGIHVMLHTPCTLRNSLPEADAPARLLKRIPDIRLTVLDNGHGCCGGAGTHMLSHPETAATLRAPLIEQIMQARPDVVATTNPGCALHLSEGLRTAGLEIPVLHPVSIVSDSLLESVP